MKKKRVDHLRQMTSKQEFETVFKCYYGGMFRLAQRMLGDEAESKDVVSDVCSDGQSSAFVPTLPPS